MGRLFILGALALGVLIALNDGKIPQVKTSGGGGSVSAYTGASGSITGGVKAAVGG